MKKQILFLLLMPAISFAQETKQFEVKNFTGLLAITGPSNGLTIEGYNGKSVIIEANVGDDKFPEKASGLKLVTANGVDNTGLAATVAEETVKMVTKVDSQGKEIEENVRVLNISLPNITNLYTNYKIKVPHNVNVHFKESLDSRGNSKNPFTISSLVGDLELDCWRCDLKISKYSGNLIANANGDKVSIEFEKLAQDKISSISSRGDVEVILPKDTKANLNLQSYRGNMYTDFDLGKVSNSKKDHKSDEWDAESFKDGISITRGSGYVSVEGVPSALTIAATPPSFENIRKGRRFLGQPNYSINDGGVHLSITSSGGNIYLKKK